MYWEYFTFDNVYCPQVLGLPQICNRKKQFCCEWNDKPLNELRQGWKRITKNYRIYLNFYKKYGESIWRVQTQKQTSAKFQKLSHIYQYNCHIEHYLYAKLHKCKKILMRFPFNSKLRCIFLKIKKIEMSAFAFELFIWLLKN